MGDPLHPSFKWVVSKSMNEEFQLLNRKQRRGNSPKAETNHIA